MTLPFPRPAPGPVLHFEVTGADHDPHALTPTLRLHTRVRDATGSRVHTVALRTQIRIEPARRRYSDAERRQLVELFGGPADWSRALNPMQLATVSTLVPGFTGSTDVVIEIPCSYDTDIAATRYFRGLSDGGIPLLLLFSGTVFYPSEQGVQVGLVPWHEEASHRLPLETWREMMAAHHAGTAWLCLPEHTLERLSAWRSARALPSWEQTFDTLLAAAGDEPVTGDPAANEPGEAGS